MYARAFQCAVLLALVAPSALEAQYRRSAADTLRYEEQTIGTIDMETPGGPVAVRSTHQATVGITFGEGDTATGWYEALRLEQQGPAGSQQPATSALLNRPFELSFDDRGRVSTRSAPEIPAEVRAVSNLSHQFDDFFISLPEGRLEIGTEWADTVAQDGLSNDASGTFHSNRVRHFRVERDTVVDGIEGVVIRIEQSIGVQASGEVPGQGFTTETTLQGTESGQAVFLPSAGVMHARERSGRLEGTTFVRGSAGNFELPQVYGYESRLTLQR